MGDKLAILYIGSYEDASLLRLLIRASPYHGSRTYHIPHLSTLSQNHNYDVIISDLSDGVENLLALKQIYPRTPVLYLGNNEALAKQAIALGAQDYLPKEELDAPMLSRIITFSQDREALTGKLKDKTFTDELTGLYNRRGFMALAEQQLRQTARSSEGFMLFFIDIDAFKHINDTYGHRIGDDALIQTAQCLRQAFRAYDIIGRIGGDEFAVLALNTRPESEEAFKRHVFSRLDELNASHHPYSISCSIGSAYYAGNGMTLEILLDKADKDLYRSKKKRLSS